MRGLGEAFLRAPGGVPRGLEQSGLRHRGARKYVLLFITTTVIITLLLLLSLLLLLATLLLSLLLFISTVTITIIYARSIHVLRTVDPRHLAPWQSRPW